MKLPFTFHDGASTRESSLELNSQPLAKEQRGRLTIQDAGTTIEVDWSEVTSRTYSILVDGRSYDVRLEKGHGAGANGATYTAHVAGRTYQLELRDPRQVRKSGGAGAHDGPLDVFAPMPGRIVKILVPAGSEVSAGGSLLVIEAMKMQNEIRAPRAGRVEAVRVKEGEGVESGALLLRLA
jgi:glutaconyl-CoA/methylmalonyl-CoA decarboxylase subunit gamma